MKNENWNSTPLKSVKIQSNFFSETSPFEPMAKMKDKTLQQFNKIITFAFTIIFSC